MSNKKSKKVYIPKGFLSRKGLPTQNSLMMFFVYLKNLPDGWDKTKVNLDSVQKVREYFGWGHTTGFENMIRWGITLECSHSQTSCERHQAMAIAYSDARGMIGKGYMLSYLALNEK